MNLAVEIKPGDVITISYSGNSIKSTDENLLEIFSDEIVKNTISYIHNVPGKIEAEHYFFQKGMELENASDEGDGKNIASLDNGDYADYYIKVNSSGTYNVTYRSAADPNWSSGGQLELSLLDPETGNYNSIQNMILPTTSGWQSWESTSKPLTLSEGSHQLRLKILEGPFNLNWFAFDDSVSIGIPIPGYIQAEDYIFQSGTSLEMTEDEGGGQNIGYLDSADYVDYVVDVSETGLYDLSYRVASDGSEDYANGGTIELQLLIDSANYEVLHTISFPSTNGWQDWVTFNDFPKIYLESGDRKLRFFFKKTPFNLNWILFEEFEGTVLGLEKNDIRLKIYPNPTSEKITVESDFITNGIITYKLVDSNGRVFANRSKLYTSKIYEEILLNGINKGLFFLVIYEGGNLLEIRKIIKSN